MFGLIFEIMAVAAVLLAAFAIASYIASNKNAKIIKDGLADKYFIRQDGDGNYMIMGQHGKVTAVPTEFEDKVYTTEELAEAHLSKFMERKLRQVHYQQFSKVVETAEMVKAMESRLLHERLEHTLAEQERLRKEIFEKETEPTKAAPPEASSEHPKLPTRRKAIA